MQAQNGVRGTSKDELNQLQRAFNSHILPHLKGASEDYDLVWGWQKFVYEKEERIKGSGED